MKRILFLLFIYTSIVQAKTDDNMAIGYQIGGHTLIGLDIEKRMNDNFGIHFGLGVKGYATGLRLHFSDDELSSFLGINFKDGGFGALQTIALQLGGTAGPSDKIGLRWEVGIQQVLNVDRGLHSEFDIAPNDILFALGIGVGFVL